MRSVAPETDPALSGIVQRALSRDAAARFASAREMAAALRGWLAGGGGATSALAPVAGTTGPATTAPDTTPAAQVPPAAPVTTATVGAGQRTRPAGRLSAQRIGCGILGLLLATPLLFVGAVALYLGLADDTRVDLDHAETLPNGQSVSLRHAVCLLGDVERVPVVASESCYFPVVARSEARRFTDPAGAIPYDAVRIIAVAPCDELEERYGRLAGAGARACTVRGYVGPWRTHSMGAALRPRFPVAADAAVVDSASVGTGVVALLLWPGLLLFALGIGAFLTARRAHHEPRR